MFFEYMAYTTSRFCEQNVSVHTFNLNTNLQESTEVDIIERCLGLVLMKGIKVLAIKAYVDPWEVRKCRLANILLSASSLTSLTVSYCELPSWSMVDVVQFKSLKLLHLREVPLDEEVIKCLNASCPLLEELNVEYGFGLKRLYIYGLQKLQKVRLNLVNGLERVDIEAPNLRECHIWFINGRGAQRSLNLALSKQLTTLRLSGYHFPTPKGFADFLSNFPLLENLFLNIPNQCNRLSLSNPSLRKVVLHVRCDLENIDINSRNLLLFSYLGKANPYEEDAPESKSRMNCCPGKDVDTLWFQKLRRFLDRTNRFSELMLLITVGSISINIEQLKLIHSLPYELEHVELELMSTHKELSVYVAILEAVLWCCRPRSLTLISDFSSIDFEEQSHVVKFTYEKLLQQEDQGDICIQFVLSSSSKVKMNFSDLDSLLTALPHEKPRKTITFIKEEVVHEEGY